MTKVDDILSIVLVGALGVGGFLIFKNRNAIGDFFGGIGKGVDDTIKGVQEGIDNTIKDVQKGIDDAVNSDVGKEVQVVANIAANPLNLLRGIAKGAENLYQAAADAFTAKYASPIDPADPTPIAAKDVPAAQKTPLVNIKGNTTTTPVPTTTTPTTTTTNPTTPITKNSELAKNINNIASNVVSNIGGAATTVFKGIGNIIATGIKSQRGSSD